VRTLVPRRSTGKKERRRLATVEADERCEEEEREEAEGEGDEEDEEGRGTLRPGSWLWMALDEEEEAEEEEAEGVEEEADEEGAHVLAS